MKPLYLLDSAVLIDHLRGIVPATAWLRRLKEGETVISVITRAEVLAVGSPGEAAAAFDLCEQFACLPLTKETADHAADLRRANGWKLPDAFQAALAIDQGLKLVTRNSKDFSEKKHAFALIPYRLD
ncbi:type II toxin-antitoxin system VapC family toxin [bacterium]|nr:MAG: type II toxin-antitoxin system VapC family toxin [bacterium]